MSLLCGGGMTGDIWSTGVFSFESPLKDLLASEDYTLEQLMAEDELLQELRGVHPQLISVFSSAEAVTKLVQYVILPADGTVPIKPANGEADASEAKPLQPREASQWIKEHKEEGKTATPEENAELRHIRFPYMACEIICCEIQKIVDTLVDGHVVSDDPRITQIMHEETVDNVEVVEKPQPRIIDLLFSVLYTTEPGKLDDYRAGYFDKILTVLFRKRPEDMTLYINKGGGKGPVAMMKALFNHLHAHSIMQIAQRLLLPQRPIPPKPPTDDEDADGAEITAGEADPAMDGMIKCDWSKNGEAITLLMGSLMPEQGDNIDETHAEVLLDRSINASEVLITIIQNSMLSSETMLTLTSSETILRLVAAATTLPRDENGEEYFSAHESLLTSAMNVLESLILQLGGYGAIGTMSLVPEETQMNESTDGNDQDEEENDESRQLIADLSSVLEHLPRLLFHLAKLLRHPSTEKWLTPTQFSKTSDQPMLGTSRLRIVRVLESLVLLGDPDVDNKLVQSDCLELCLNLFWEFQWCSMLHQSVANLLVHVFEGRNARVEMQEYFLLKCNLMGRLMESFTEMQRITDAVAEKADKIPVSEDDVDAAMEQQESDKEGDGVVVEPPPQSFRLGYMGHVIIICQALVHACTTGVDDGEHVDEGDRKPDTPRDADISGLDSTQNTHEEQEPLLLAEMVASHPQSTRWQEFIATTLATETAIQSTPLGGFAGSPQTRDPFHSHRPGPDDGDIRMDDSLEQPNPPRGMLGGGEVIDMDDNDLDVAASMMAGLSLGGRMNPPVGGDHDGDGDDSSNSGSYGSGDSDRSYNSGETANSGGGYAFDDPLGKTGGLGIELGKLTQYKSNLPQPGAPVPQPKPDEMDDQDEDNDSSDEEPEAPSTGDGNVPVMDLFAGNFNHGMDTGAPPDGGEAGGWSADFASFEAPPDDFGAFESAPTISEAAPAASDAFAKPEIEDLFAKADATSLLEEVLPAEEAPGAPSDPFEASPFALDEVNTGEGEIKPVDEDPIPIAETTEIAKAAEDESLVESTADDPVAMNQVSPEASDHVTLEPLDEVKPEQPEETGLPPNGEKEEDRDQ